MLPELKAMDYKNVLFYFSEIAGIPHGSGNTEKLADYLEEFAKNKKIQYIREQCGNIIFYLPATKGYEERETLVLQGHMDMVCEKRFDCKHDFEKEGLSLKTDGQFLSAEGTTLGGDDGIAVAYMLAIMSDQTLPHPTLELLVTTEEETGMDGARSLLPERITGRYLINLDSEEEYRVLCGCAGGVRVNASFSLRRETKKGVSITIRLTGLQGGHSGSDIDKERTNAVRFLSRFLFELREDTEFYVVSVSGGRKDNAIPREAEAVLLFEKETVFAACEKMQALSEMLLNEIHSSEEKAVFSILRATVEKDYDILSENSFEKLLFFLLQAPCGVQKMSMELPGVAESSLNLGILSTDSEEAIVTFLLRSSKKSYLNFLKEKLSYLIEMLNGEASESSEYPAWEFQADSLLLKTYQSAYEEMFGKPLQVTAIHAGLECGLFAGKLSKPEMISIGPDMENVHTPEERLSLASALRVYRLIEKILADGGIK